MQYVRGIGQSQQAPQAAPVKEVTHIAGLSCRAPAQEPCRSYVLRDVICMYCNHCTDLDLCRDPALQVGCHYMRLDTACFLKEVRKAHTLALPFMSTHASCMLCSNLRRLRCEDRVELALELLRLAVEASKPRTTPQTAAASAGSNARKDAAGMTPELLRAVVAAGAPVGLQGLRQCLRFGSNRGAAGARSAPEGARLPAAGPALHQVPAGGPPLAPPTALEACEYIGAAQFQDKYKH